MMDALDRRLDIICALRKRTRKSLSQLSKEHGFDRSAFSQTLCKKWRNVEEIMAKLLDTTPEKLFPERYP
ncbi:MAG: helix-turn-helix domain-containing protein [Magnetococcales bacterium]|nr:helix-turn-helix domain-containing protein [Magnetococcales bacterium]